MSEEPKKEDALPTPAPAPGPPESKKPVAGKPKLSRRRRWARRVRIALLAILLLAIILRVALHFMLPLVIRRTAARYGLNASYERHDINLTGGDVGLWHLILTPIEGGQPLLRVEYCRADVSTIDLLRGRLVVHRLETEGVDLIIERTADGQIPLIKRFAGLISSPSPSSSAPAAPAATATNVAGRRIDLSSPFVMDAFRVDHVRTYIRDKHVSPELNVLVETNLRLTDLKSAVRPTRIELEVTGSPLLDSLVVRGQRERTGNDQDLEATLNIVMRGLHPREVAAYLKPLGIVPLAHGIGADMTLHVKATAATQPACLAAAITFSGISVTADGQESLGLDKLTVDADTLGQNVAHISRIAMNGVHATAMRSAKGRPCIAGLEWAPLPPRARSSPAPVPAAPVVHAAPTAFRWSVGELDLNDMRLALRDQAIEPAADLQLTVNDLAVKNVAQDRTAPLLLTATLLAPGTAQAIHLTGSASPFAEPGTADLKLAVDGIDPQALRPYFDVMGVDCTLKRGSLTCALHGDLSRDAVGHSLADAQLTDLRFGDGVQLLNLNDVRISGLGLDALPNQVQIQSIEISGPHFDIKRLATGSLAALGFSTKPPTRRAVLAAASEDRTPAAVAAPAVGQVTESFPRVEIGKFIWKEVSVRFEDDHVSPAAMFDVQDAGMEISDLVLDLNPPPGSPELPARLHAWLKVPGVVGDIQMTGTVTPGAKGPEAALEVVGQGLHAQPVATYLKSAGIEPVLRDGSLRMKTRLSLQRRGDGLTGSVAVENLRFEDVGTELIGIDSLNVPTLELRGSDVWIDDMTIVKPRLRVTREKNGALCFAGIRTLQPQRPPGAAVESLQPSGSLSVAAPAPASLPVVSIKSLHVNDASLHWSDQNVAKVVDLDAKANVEMERFVFGKGAEAAKLTVVASAGGCVDKLTLGGEFTPSLDSPAGHFDITAIGLRAGPLTAYLPPEIRTTLKDGRLSATLDADMRANPKGGKQGRLIVTKVDYRDGPGAETLLKLDSMRLLVSRFDPHENIALDELSLTGLETEVHKTSAGPRLLGFVLDQTTAVVVPPAVLPPAAVVAAAPVVTTPQVSTVLTPADLARLAAQTKRKLPLITLEKLDLDVARITLIDDTRPASAPLTLLDLHGINHGRVELLGPRPEDCPPAQFEFCCRPGKLADSFSMRIKTSPFSLQPTAQIDVAASGIKGDAILASFPEMKVELDGSELTDGRFKAHVEATIVKIDRQDLLRFDLSRPFDADVIVKGLEFRNKEDGPLLAGVEEIRSEGMHIVPRTRSVSAKSVEITNLAGRAIRQKDGIHALGLVLKLQSPPAAQEPAPAPPAEQTIVRAPSTPTGPIHQPPPTSEIRVDKFEVTGIKFQLEDQAVDPAFVVPINSFDLEVRGFTTRMFYEEKTCRFSLLANTGKVELLKLPKNTGLIDALAGGSDADTGSQTEQRDLLSQITASGSLSFYPHPKGWVKGSLSGLELASLKGEARAQGVKLSGGTFDADIDAHLPGDGSMELRPRFVFEDLSLADSPDGVIKRGLLLPAPVDIVIKALQDSSGQITVPLSISIQDGHINKSEVISSAIVALGLVTATAVASAPVKVVGGVASTFGLNLGPTKEAPIPPITLTFAPGDAVVFLPDRSGLDLLLKRLAKDKTAEIVIRQELSAGDVETEAMRANPSEPDALNLAQQLRQKKMELLKSRALLAGQARAELAAGLASTPTLERLRAVDRELASAENAMDDLYDLFRPGAEHQTNRRTRQASLVLASERLAAARDLLISAGLPGLAARIHVTPAQYNPTDSADGGQVVIVSGKTK